MPANETEAGTPPTVTARDWVGFGRLATAVPEAGALPVASDGDTSPSPVTYIVITWPRAPVLLGTAAPLESAKIPGAADDTRKFADAVCPLVVTVSSAFAFRAVW